MKLKPLKNVFQRSYVFICSVTTCEMPNGKVFIADDLTKSCFDLKYMIYDDINCKVDELKNMKKSDYYSVGAYF